MTCECWKHERGATEQGMKRDLDVRVYEYAGRLTELLGQNVELAPDCIGEEVKAKIAALKVGPFWSSSM